MPNLVPISQTPHAALLHFLSAAAHNAELDRFMTEPLLGAVVNVQRTRESWTPCTYAFTSPFEGVCKPWKDASGATHFEFPSSKPCKPATRYAPNKTDLDVRIAQLFDITGLKGTAVLSRADWRTGEKATGRMISARGRPTPNVPIHLSGSLPDMSACMPVTDGKDMTVTGSEIRFLKRYRETMRGEAYAKAMAMEKTERNSAYWRAAFPWIPSDKNGIIWTGKPYNRADGIGERIYSDDTMLSERKRDWDAAHKGGDIDPNRVMPESERLRLIAELAEEQADDDRRGKRGKL